MSRAGVEGVDWPTGLMVVQGNRLEVLREVMVGWLKRYPLGPLEPEHLLVQSNGIAQWLKQALAESPARGGCGIAAALEVDLPGRFIWQAYRSVLPDLPSVSPYDKRPLTWRLFRLLGQLAALNQPELLAPLTGFLEAGRDPDRRRYQLAGRLADLYDQYQVYRADWLEAWSAGRDCLIRPDRSERPLEPEQLWQPMIWRALNADIAADPSLPEGRWERQSRAQIHHTFIDSCAGLSERPEELPRRVVVFGISSLPRQTLEVLQAIAPHTQVLLFTLNPCQHYWGDLIEGRELLQQEYKRARKRPERDHIPLLSLEQLHQYGNPLLASWGKQGRDYLHLLDERDEPGRYRECFVDHRIDLFESPGEATLLQQLQADILELRPLHEARTQARAVDPEHDRSLRFMEAHSPQREIEILHDQLLDAFERARADGQPLEPRDVLVMVPDINVYAPHIEAVFGRYQQASDGARDPRYLPFHIADQGQRHRNPLLIAIEHLLRLPQARFEATELLDLLEVPALRARLGLQEGDLPRLKQWIEGANIRWGLNAEQRASLELPAGQEQNSWVFGLRRMLLGYAAGSSDAWAGIQPYDEVGGLEAALLGPLVLLLEQLEQSWRALQQARTPADWVSLLQAELERYFSAASDSDTRLLTALGQQLDAWLLLSQSAGLDAELIPPDVVRDELLANLDQPDLNQRFLGGAINFATLMPMRAIPFRQIWLLGMNDGDYPRSVVQADFDLMARDYRPGDRSRREDDRYLFLEALLSAREQLVISWLGRNIRDNSERPPSVLVGQLRDYLEQAWPQPGLLEALTTQYPLQPFSARYFAAPVDPTLFTYAREWEAVHDGSTRIELPDLARQRLPAWQPEGALTPLLLRDFLRAPVDALFRQRLRLPAPDELADTPVAENFSLDGLQQWSLKDRLIAQAFVPGLDAETLARRCNEELVRLTREGELIEGAFGALQGETLSAELQPLYEKWNACQQAWRPLPEQPHRLQCELNLEHGTAVSFSAEVPPLLQAVDDPDAYLVMRLQTSSVVRKHQYEWRNVLPGWLDHLVATLVLAEVAGTSHGRLTTRLLTPAGAVHFTPVSAEQAREYLSRLAQCWFEGMHQPLPLTLYAGMKWVRPARSSRKPLEEQARDEFDTRDLPRSEFLPRVFAEFDALRADGRFETLAQQLYQPIADQLEVED